MKDIKALPFAHPSALGTKPFSRDPLGLLTAARSALGPLFVISIGPAKLVVVADADIADAVLRRRADAFAKPRFQRAMLAPFFGAALTTASGADWKARRQVLMTAMRSAAGRADAIAHAVAEAFVADESDADLVTRWQLAWTRGLCSELLGVGPDDSAARAYVASIRRTIDLVGAHIRTGVPLPRWWPLGRVRAISRARLAQHRAVSTWLADADPQLPLPTALRASAYRGRPEVVRDELNIAIGLGASQCAIAMSWASVHVAREPELQRHAASSSDAAVAAMNDALRSYPPFYALLRAARQDVTIDNLRLARGQLLLVSIWLLHRDPEQPMFIPFGAGPAACAARQLLQRTLGQTLHRVLRQRSLAMATTAAPTPRPGLVLGFAEQPRLITSPRQLPRAVGAD